MNAPWRRPAVPTAPSEPPSMTEAEKAVRRKVQRAAAARRRYAEDPEKGRARARAAREKDPEKAREACRRYREQNPEKIIARYKLKREANRESALANEQAAREARRARINELQRERRWANCEQDNVKRRAWYQANAEAERARAGTTERPGNSSRANEMPHLLAPRRTLALVASSAVAACPLDRSLLLARVPRSVEEPTHG